MPVIIHGCENKLSVPKRSMERVIPGITLGAN